jgi:hypothetical protein
MRKLLILFVICFDLLAETIYKTIPGTSFKDITEPVMVIEKNVIYKTIPNTPYKDPTEPVMIIDKGFVYPTIPNTTIRDYSLTPQFVIE